MQLLLHADLNNFFASVELLDRPDLRGRPLIVGGSVEARHGVVFAKSSEAKACGVRTAETLPEALHKCPGAVVIPPHHDKYRAASQRAKALFRELSPRMESFGIDEAWLDLEASPWLTEALRRVRPDEVEKEERRLLALRGEPQPYCLEERDELRRFLAARRLADGLRARCRRELGLTLSVGVSWNKAYAKLGSDYKKPDATTMITPWDRAERLWQLDVGNLLFVGESTREKLKLLNIRSIGELAESRCRDLEELFGRFGPRLRARARGEEDSPVLSLEEQEEIKSIGNSVTLAQDITRYEEAEQVLKELAQKVAQRAAREKRLGACLRLQVKDSLFREQSRQMSLSAPTRNPETMAREAMALLRENYDFRRPVRLLGLTLCKLISEDESPPEQMSLREIADKPPAFFKARAEVARLQERFGSALKLGLSRPSEKREKNET